MLFRSVFDASIEQLLWPEKRSGDVTYRTASGGLLRGQVDVLPENAYLNVPESNLPGWAVSVVNLLTGDRYAAGKGLRIGPIPAGTPVNLIAGIDLDTRPGFFADLAHKARLLGLALKLNATFAKITPQTSADEARQIFRDDVAADLIAADKCSDYIVNRGHYFGTRFFADPSGAPAAGLSDEEKRDLIEFLKTL